MLRLAPKAVCGAFDGGISEFYLLTKKFFDSTTSYVSRGDYDPLLPIVGQTFVYKGGGQYAIWYGPGSGSPAVLTVIREPTSDADGLTWYGVALRSRPRLGVGLAGPDLSGYPNEVFAKYDIPRIGAMVVKVEKGSPAAEVGLLDADYFMTVRGVRYAINGDIITHADGKVVYDSDDLLRTVLRVKSGGSLTLTINRTGKTLKVKVKPRVIP